MQRTTAVRVLAGGAVAGALGLTTILAGAEPPKGRYGGDRDGYGYRKAHAYAACKPGWGFGDRNHCHFGPPGLVGKLGLDGNVEDVRARAEDDADRSGQRRDERADDKADRQASRANEARGAKPADAPPAHAAAVQDDDEKANRDGAPSASGHVVADDRRDDDAARTDERRAAAKPAKAEKAKAETRGAEERDDDADADGAAAKGGGRDARQRAKG